jgi:hypothetical protein
MRTSDLLPEDDRPGEGGGDVDLLDGRAGEFRDRWTEIQTGFVDEPQQAVERADGLVAEVITAIAERFTRERTSLEQRWSEDSVSTEDLRVTLRSYRDFFERLLDAPTGASSSTTDDDRDAVRDDADGGARADDDRDRLE